MPQSQQTDQGTPLSAPTAGADPAAVGSQPLAERQAALVAALLGAGTPAGFDATLIEAARTALARKRAGQVAGAWPALAAALGPDWNTEFAAWARRAWAAGHPPGGSLRDGWDFARALTAHGSTTHRSAALGATAPEPTAPRPTAPGTAAPQSTTPRPTGEPAGPARLSCSAVRELAEREVRLRYDGSTAPRRRRLPAYTRIGTTRAIQVLGRVWLFGT